MIEFEYQKEDFKLSNELEVVKWLSDCAVNFDNQIADLTCIFCDDDFLLEINKAHLNHDYYTDVIGFSCSEGVLLSGDIFISVDRVVDNAKHFKVSFKNELLRVMAHGLLHFMGFNDSSELQIKAMTTAEDTCISLYKNENI